MNGLKSLSVEEHARIQAMMNDLMCAMDNGCGFSFTPAKNP
jgi:hypothetical protein